MIKNLLIFLLVSAVSFQSIAAVSDMHESHQTGAEHLEFEHEHDEPAKVVELDNQTAQKSFDCHHCCHCHGGHLTSILPSGLSLAFLYGNQSLSNLNQIIKNTHLSRLLRPPQV